MNCSNIVQVSKQHVTISPNGEFFVTMHAGKIIVRLLIFSYLIAWIL